MSKVNVQLSLEIRGLLGSRTIEIHSFYLIPKILKIRYGIVRTLSKIAIFSIKDAPI